MNTPVNNPSGVPAAMSLRGPHLKLALGFGAAGVLATLLLSPTCSR